METKQIEFWSGEFGKEYTDRNTRTPGDWEQFYLSTYGINKQEINTSFFSEISADAKILEVGCNTGMQLACLQRMGFKNLYGIELQEYAVEKAKKYTKGINIIQGSGFDIPFKDDYFDLVCTNGVLIHIAPGNLKEFMFEMVRCSEKYIMGFEYYSDQLTEIDYRGNKGFLWKADYAKTFMENFHDLKLIKKTLYPYVSHPELQDCAYLLKKLKFPYLSNSSIKTIAIIPARGGSKRISRKNIRLFKGRPVISYSIEAATKSGLFDVVMVSTDDSEIENISKNFGAEVPFNRSAETSDDFSSTADVLVEVLNQYKNRSQVFKYACCIYPAAPLISVENLSAAFQLLKKNNYSTVFPICEFTPSVYRALKLNQNGKVEMLWNENLNKRSQDLPPAFHDSGQFYWMHVESFLKENALYTTNSGAIILDKTCVQDVDTESDWKIAEMKYTLLNE